MRVYIGGSSSELDRVKAATRLLKARGVEVVSKWVESVEKVGTANPANVPKAFRENIALGCLEDLATADCFWLLFPQKTPGRGAFVELGQATTHQIPIMISGHNSSESVFSALGEEFDTDAEAADRIIELAKEYNSLSVKLVSEDEFFKKDRS
jgi:hypothetical protein